MPRLGRRPGELAATDVPGPRQTIGAPLSGEPAAGTGGFRLAKVIGVFAVMASALTQEYGSGINLVAPNSAGAYPRIENLVPLAMIVTGILLLPKVALFMRFSAHMPRAGSTYAWIGRTLSLPVGFVVTFVWWVGLGGSLGVLSYAFATFLSQAFRVGGWPGATWLAGNSGHLLLGLVAIWFFVLVNSRGVRSYGVWVRALVVIVVIVAAIVVGYGFATNPAHFAAIAGRHAHLRLQAPAHAPRPTLGAFFSVAGVFVFAYGGLTAAPALGGEARDARRTVPLGLLFAWAAALVLFTLVTAAVFHAAPWWAVRDLVQHKKTALATVPGLIGLVAPHLVALTIDVATAVIVAKTINPALMAMSRTMFGWAEDGLVPVVFARTSARKAPVTALVLSGILGSAFLVETVVEGFTLGVVIRSLSILIVVAAVAVGVINVRYGQKERFAGKEWAAAIARGSGIVVAAVLAIAVSALFVSSTLTTKGKGLFLQPWFETLVAAGVGLLLWLQAARKARASGVDLSAVQAQPPLE